MALALCALTAAQPCKAGTSVAPQHRSGAASAMQRPQLAARRCPRLSWTARSPATNGRLSEPAPRRSTVASATGRSGNAAAAAAAAALPLAIPLVDKEGSGPPSPRTSSQALATGLGRLLAAEPRHVSSTIGDSTLQRPLDSDGSGSSCTDGHCQFARQGKSSSSPGLASLGGLSVATLDVNQLGSNVVTASPAAVALHPDAAARQEAREARKARRRTSVRLIAEQDWWKTSAPDNVIEVESEEDFKSTLEQASSSGRMVVVDYFAPYCQACRRQYPDVLQYAAARPDVLFVKVNAANMRPMCEDLGVERLPSYSLYRPGNEQGWLTAFFVSLTGKLGSVAS